MTESRERVVVKFGSELVANGGLRTDAIENYVSGLVTRFSSSDLTVVTSGAVAIGRSLLGSDAKLATAASIGVLPLMAAWQRAFWAAGRYSGQVLVTHHDLTDATKGKNKLLATTEGLLHDNVIPIVNANDTLSDEELMKLAKCADNDGLALHLASVLGARMLVLFTNKGGIFDESKELIPFIHPAESKKIVKMLADRPQSDGIGRGGMASKLAAALSFAEIHQDNVAYIAQPNEDMSGALTTAVSQNYALARHGEVA